MIWGSAIAKRKSQRVGHREAARRHEREKSRAERDIWPLPPIANVRRRNRCKHSLRLFCETYNRNTFFWGWSEDHLRVIAAIEQGIKQGAQLAFAMPRGSGKTSLCRMAILWAVSYAHVCYAFLIGANETKAVESLGALKRWMEALPEYAADFPEISVAARYLGESPNRANGMLCDGERTFVEWGMTKIVLPRVRKPKNLRSKGRYAPTSGVVVGVSGLTGDGIRGSLFAHPDGRQVRPDLVLLDDPQTDESARSPQQNIDREDLIAGAVLGMANPDRPLAAIMPCTVIHPEDMASRALDRKRNPLWRGVKTGILRSMPADLAAWEKYWDAARELLGQDVPDRDAVNRLYVSKRADLDKGAVAAWSDRKTWEVSAVQHAMHLYFANKRRFWAEYQNCPLDERKVEVQLSADLVARKLNGLARGVVPLRAQHVTGMVDVHDSLLYWLVAAWEPDFTGYVIDYGVWPEQPYAIFSLNSAFATLRQQYPGTEKEGAILAGLEHVTSTLVAREFRREDGAAMRIGRLFADSKYETDTVKAFCRRSAHAAIVMPSQGFYLRPGVDWGTFFRSKPGGLTGNRWRLPPPADGTRYVLYDADWWKTTWVERIRIALGDRGCWSIFGRDPREHALLADHCVAEKPEWRQQGDAGKWHWELPSNRPDNHWWDCWVGSAVGASMLGVVVPGTEAPKRKSPAERPSLADLAGRR